MDNMNNGNATVPPLVNVAELPSELGDMIKGLGDKVPLLEAWILSSVFPIVSTPLVDIHELDAGTWVLARLDTPLLSISDELIPVRLGDKG